jgi:hypothetical protein
MRNTIVEKSDQADEIANMPRSRIILKRVRGFLRKGRPMLLDLSDRETGGAALKNTALCHNIGRNLYTSALSNKPDKYSREELRAI